MMKCLKVFGLLTALLFATPVSGATLTVGPGKTYATLALAYAAAANGDVIDVYPATYTDDIITVNKSNLTIEGIGITRPLFRQVNVNAIDAANGKALINVNTSAINFTAKNLEFTGFTSPISGNGAAFRFNSSTLQTVLVDGCYIHDGQQGILGDADSLTISNTELARCGGPVNPEHNIYITGGRSFTLLGCFSHAAIYGHEVKSRAANNYIIGNRLCDENGDGTYVMDIPNAGYLYAIGNIFDQGPNSPNSDVVSYGAENTNNGLQTIYYINNTFANHKSFGRFIFSRAGTPAVIVKNNIFYGPGTISGGAAITSSNNFIDGTYTNQPGFVNDSYDYHLTLNSPPSVVNAGSNPGSALSGFNLSPSLEYVFDLSTTARSDLGALDLGAFGLRNPGTVGVDSTLSYFVPQANCSPDVPIEGAAAIAYATMCPDNDTATNCARLKIVLRNSNNQPIVGVSAADIYALINGGPASQGFSGAGDDTVMASSVWQPVAGCPDVRQINAGWPSDATGVTYINWRGSNPTTPGVTQRDPERKWGMYAGDIPIYALGVHLRGKLTSDGALGSYTAHIRNFDFIPSLTLNTGEVVNTLELNAITAAINNPYNYSLDFDANGVIDINDYNLVRQHVNHKCNYPNGN